MNLTASNSSLRKASPSQTVIRRKQGYNALASSALCFHLPLPSPTETTCSPKPLSHKKSFSSLVQAVAGLASLRPMRSSFIPRFLCAGLLVLGLALSGCAGHQSLLSPLDDALNDTATEEAAEELLQSDRQGAIPAPNIPPELAHQKTTNNVLTLQTSDSPIAYTVHCESPDDPALAKTFLQINSLTKMQETPLYSATSLEQRLETSLKEARDILHANGYYTGHAQGDIEFSGGGINEGQNAQTSKPSPLKAEVTVSFSPGPQYTLGKTIISHTEQPKLDAGLIPLPVPLENPAHTDGDSTQKSSTSDPSPARPSLLYDFHPQDAPALPRSLEDLGLAPSDPALADKVLDAVDRVQKDFRNSGYPEAKITSTQYFLNHQTQTLDVEIHVLPGSFIRMGELSLPPGASVNENYLLAKQTWKVGQPWNQDTIEAYRDALRQTGLFVSMTISPAKQDEDSSLRPIEVTLTPAPERTIGGSLKYDTSFGPGVQAFWEHRNLTGHGDSLRLEAPVWMDMQEVTAKYRLPYFLRDDQDFIAQLGFLNEDVDAYNLQAVRLAAGLDRRLSRHWKATLQGSAESGSLKDPKKPREEYLMFGLPFMLAFDSTNSILDATKGGRATLGLAPYTGEYRDDFTVLRSRLDLQRFIPLVDEDTLVLALRGTLGTMTGADAGRVPPSVRFYSGGGGSVRGYEYQSLGPRNYRDDPLGGSALTEVSIEPRWRFSETFGVVAFVDGGMAYDEVDDIGKDLRWGAGLGLRLYTPIGPVRVDVATPLNPRSDDDPVQFYMSIGQSF